MEDIVDVNATTRHALRASEKFGPNGRMQEAEHLLEDAESQEVVGLANLLRGAIELTTRTNSGQPAVIRVPHSILAVLVTVALALIGAGFWLVSSITEMKTNLTTIQQNQRDIKNQQSSNLKLMTAYTTNETNRVNFMTGLLTEDQRRQIYEYNRANPRPPLPDTNDSPDETERKP